MEKYKFSATLAVHINSEKIQSFIDGIRSDVILTDYSLYIFYDETETWLYIYSNQFEIISKRKVVSLINFMENKDQDFIFVNIFNENNFCVCCRFQNKLQICGSNLWNMWSEAYNYIYLDNLLISQFQPGSDNICTIMELCNHFRIKPDYLLSGFDKVKTNVAKVTGKCKEFKEYKIKKAYEKTRIVKIVTYDGIYMLPLAVLNNLYLLDSNLQGINLYIGKQVLDYFSEKINIKEVYFILSEQSTINFKYREKNREYKNEQMVLRFCDLTLSEIEFYEFTEDILTVVCEKEPQEYARFDNFRYDDILPNTTGIEKNDGIMIYTHSKRVCPWKKTPSEWNIDSISSIGNPYPLIAVSRRFSENKKNEKRVEFKIIREEEDAHFHPEFIEIYQCLSGKLLLQTCINNKQRTLQVNDGEIALIMPTVPHFIDCIEYGKDGHYSHVCVQLLSKFHYPFFSTKRNYEFQEELGL